MIEDPGETCPDCHEQFIHRDECVRVKKHYRIMGNYQRSTEEIDHASSEHEANVLKAEYQMAFGRDWHIWVEVQNIADGELNDIYPLE